MTPGTLHRLHPSTILIELVRLAKGWAIPIVLLLVVAPGDEGMPGWLRVGIAAAGVSLCVTIIRYLSLRYGVEGDRLVIRSGVVFRRHRAIPLDRIQNIHLKGGVLHRLFRVVEVRVETAGTGEAEAHLSVIARVRAEAFRQEVLESVTDTASSQEGGGEEGLIRRARLSELLLAGATENRIGVLVAGAWGVFEFSGDFGFESEQFSDFVQDDFLGFASLPLTVVMLGLTFVMFGWLASIAWTLITYHGFRLWRNGPDLSKSHGLLTRFESTIPVERIQMLRLESTWLRRLFHVMVARVETAGSKADATQGGTTVLVPLIAASEAEALCRHVYPDTRLHEAPLHRVPKRSRRRRFLRNFLPGAVVIGGALYGFDAWRFWPLLLAWALLSLLHAHAWHRVLGYDLPGRFLLARAGVFTRKLWIIPQDKVQGVAVQRSPLQRWMGFATLQVATAGGGRSSDVEVVDMASDEAERVFETLARVVARGGSRGGL